MGLSRNLLCILQNIPDVVVIMHRGHGYDCRIYMWLDVIDIRIYRKQLCGGGGGG